MILYNAYNRDMEMLFQIFSIYNPRLLYIQVYLDYLSLFKKTKMFKEEVETLSRYLWKYQYLTINEFKQYH